MIRLKRVYESAHAEDGLRILVDRLWPRGVSRQTAQIDWWAKDIAPSPTLRRWFGHDPARWPEFQRRYRAELDNNPQLVEKLMERVREDRVTLIYAARNTAHNGAVVLKAYLETRECK